MENRDLQATIEDLQSRLVFQEDAIDHLNKTIAQQDQAIELLRQQVQYLYGQVKQLSEQQRAESPQSEIPPHY